MPSASLRLRRVGFLVALLLLDGGCGQGEADLQASAGGGSGGSAAGGGSSTGGLLASGGLASAGGVGQLGGSAGSGVGGAGWSSGGAPLGGSGVGGGSVASGGGAAPSGGSGGTAVQPVDPAIGPGTRYVMSNDGLTIVSYGGYLNGESFQQDGVTSFGGYQYLAFWNRARHVVLSRRKLGESSFESVEFTDYTNKEDDAHNTISIGICPGDGTLHLAFDHHNSSLHYRRSAFGLLDGAAAFSTSSFSAVTSSLVNGSSVSSLTYPRFVTSPDGETLLLSARLGESGSGDEHLWEYASDGGVWSTLGKYIDGQSADENPYPHGLAYGPGGRLSIAWCTRATPDATTNHDLFHMWSDDRGRTWKSDASETVATTGQQAVAASAPSVLVWEIPQNRGLINQEHMAADPNGGIHVLLSHMPDSEADSSNFTQARSRSQYFHYYRAPGEEWVRHAMGEAALENFRGKLGFAPSGNAYAVLPNLRIVAAAVSSNFEEWRALPFSPTIAAFSDPLIDAAELASGTLSIFAPLKGSGELDVLDFEVQ